MTAPFAGYQYEIYLAGLAGQRPQLPADLTSLEPAAEKVMTSEAFGYVAGAAGSEATARANRAAFDRWRIVPRMLRDVAERDLSTTVLGTAMPAPLMLAPLGVQSIIHAEGEVAVARAASSLGIPFVLSTAASHTLEEVASAAGDGPRWFQLYWPRDPDVTASLISRAEAAGYSALVVTLDTWLLGYRPRDLQQAYLPFLLGEGIANYLSDPAFRAGLSVPPEDDRQAAIGHFIGMFSDPSVTWDDLDRLRSLTTLPIVLKGILHPDDARRAADSGIDGVIVSNHGGRQVDGAIGALDALAPVVNAIGDRLAVLFDSGVRTGSDAVKAFAFGARAVLIGRSFAYGLALGGEDGVRHVLRSFLADLDLNLSLSGFTKPDQLEPSILAPAP